MALTVTDPTDFVKKESLRIAGVPILANELDDTGFADQCLNPALYEYWIYAPYEYAKEFQVQQRGPFPVNVPDVTTMVQGWPAGVTAEHVGLTGFQFGMGRVANALVFGGLDYKGSMFAQLENLTIAQVQDNADSDEIIHYDRVAGKYTIFCPVAGKIGMMFGYRLGGATSIMYVRPSHVLVFSKIVAKKFLELMIAGRSSVLINSDVTYPVDFMKEKLAQIYEDLKTDTCAITIPFITWG